MQHKTYILSLSKHSQIKVYAIIVINGFCRLKLLKDHPVGDPPAGLPYPLFFLSPFSTFPGGDQFPTQDFSGIFWKKSSF